MLKASKLNKDSSPKSLLKKKNSFSSKFVTFSKHAFKKGNFKLKGIGLIIANINKSN